MTVGIYIRVSTEEQAREGYSISAQKEKLKAFCKVNDWLDYKFYVDEGISAKDLNRPQLQLMIDHIKKGLINIVLVYRLDRLTRSVLDLYKLLELFEKYDCKFRSATEVYDTSTAMGRMFITLVAAMAQWERENLGERVRMGQIEKARQGGYSAPAPFGYDKKGDKLIINEDEARIFLEMVEKIEEGYSLRQLAKYLDESGYPPVRGYKWHIGSIKNMLHNPVYYGATRWLDEINENTHKGIITKERFERLQKILEDRQLKKKRNVKSIFIFQMKLICPTCGRYLTSERNVYVRKKDGVMKEYNGYRCQACALNKRKALYVSERKIEKAFIKYMKTLSYDKMDIEITESDDDIVSLKKQIEKINRQREKYQKAWGMDLITDEEFTNRMNETKKSLQKLKDKLTQIQPIQQKEVDKEKIIDIAKNFELNWKNMVPKEKRHFVNMFVKNIYFKKNDKVKVTDIDFY